MASLFKVLSSEKRREMLRLLRKEEMHLSGLARRLNISVPVALRHIKMLEDAKLVVREKMGSTHIFKINNEEERRLHSLWLLLDEPLVLSAKKGATLLETLKGVPAIAIKKTKQGHYIDSVDGRKGFFVYEIDGKIVDKSIDKLILEEDCELEIKRLIPALDKKIRIKIE